jgi:L-rhamnose mutarotase
MKKYCLALDLQNDKEKISAYIKYHQKVWPEINQSIRESGIRQAEIFNTRDRLFMILEVDNTFSFEKKAKLDADNPKVQEWEKLMWEFHKALPDTPPGTKWVLMDKIYDLNKNE